MRTRDEKKELAIREKAVEMIVKEGFDGFSIQKLAKAAGVSPATIYIYYKDREDLIITLCMEMNSRMANATLKDFDPEMSFNEGLRIQWRNRANYCLENSKEMHFSEQVRFSPLYEKCEAVMDPVFRQKMTQFVKNAIARNELVPLPVEVYWSVAFAPLYQLVKFHMSGRGLASPTPFILNEDILDRTLNIVVKALQP